MDARAPAKPERGLRWDGCVNVRDLGGLPLAGGGGETAYRVIVRADWLPGLSDKGREALRRLRHLARRRPPARPRGPGGRVRAAACSRTAPGDGFRDRLPPPGTGRRCEGICPARRPLPRLARPRAGRSSRRPAARRDPLAPAAATARASPAGWRFARGRQHGAITTDHALVTRTRRRTTVAGSPLRRTAGARAPPPHLATGRADARRRARGDRAAGGRARVSALGRSGTRRASTG